MCGIFLYSTLSPSHASTVSPDIVKNSFYKIQNRGPDFSTLQITKEKDINQNTLTNYLGFHRLSIMDTSSHGNQPFIYENENRKITLICNGEIYNYKQLIHKYPNIFKMLTSHSDCEVILYMYLYFGIIFTSQALDGEFAFIITDTNKITKTTTIYAVRDRIGVRPLFYFTNGSETSGSETNVLNNTIGLCSEMKGLIDLIHDNSDIKIQVFPPSNILQYNVSDNIFNFFQYYYFDSGYIGESDSKCIPYQYNIYKEQDILKMSVILTLEQIQREIVRRFTNCVHKRMHTNRPLGFLLSGGLDSSIVGAIASKYLRDTNNSPLKTFTIGLENSADLKYAKICSEYIDSNHTEFIVSEAEALNSINETIFITESYDITTIRASVWQNLLAKKIKENTDIKVLLVGEGSDELMQGYVYFKNAPDTQQALDSSKKLITNIHRFDGLRVDRCMSNSGLEVRVPFLDTDLVSFIYSINPEYLRPELITCDSLSLNLGSVNQGDLVEKALFRNSFYLDSIINKEQCLLPNEILYRPKFAFSDLTNNTKSWVDIITEHMDTLVSDEEFQIFLESDKYSFNKPYTKESYYYRKKFEEYYPNQSAVIPYFWLPEWTDVKDPSARKLTTFVDSV